LFVAGSNARFELGLNDTLARSTLTPHPFLSSVGVAVAGRSVSFALGSSPPHAIYAWGNNANGALGIPGAPGVVGVPAQVPNTVLSTDVSMIAVPYFADADLVAFVATDRPCGAGFFSATGFLPCGACAANTFAPWPQATTCFNCDSGLTSSAGSASCGSGGWGGRGC
jgi:hypothetical protein